MPHVDIENARIHYELAGPNSAPVLVFSNSLGTSLAMWEPQVSTLARTFRVLRYDGRGQGQSSVSPGSYTISQLAADVVALLDKLNIRRAHYCGLSMGGMVGMTLALHAPDRLGKMILSNTAPKIGSADVWNARIETVQKGGMAAVVDGVLDRWFTPGFRAKSPTSIESTRKMLLNSPVEGYVACCAAVRDMDARDSIARITTPTLIISGVHDPVTPPHDGREMAERIPRAEYRELPAAHLSNIEAANAFTMELTRFLSA